VAWRELCLLLERPPGREAYPGDVFYLHSRLLERSTQLQAERGGGSLTALPVATTEDGRLSAYIPTNLIAITDGQLVLSRSMFSAGERPAVDAGLSVSRVGGKTQAQAFRKLAARLRLDYAAFLELESFARVTRLEASARRRLELGRRIRRLLRAPRLQALGVFEELVRLTLAERTEALLRIPEEEVSAFAAELPEQVRALDASVAEGLDAGRVVLSDADAARLSELVERVVHSRWPVG
jgi:F-type H+-transporting ATPase subunit alpha